ncbi:hypothetical protein DKX38_009200 [Salix brachista]|uniref:Uncharacterized protein n=1 Tax=Salix brachista TaxID=2182728 RepID=A0A5N5MA50_9ROSI|nr:hypothetical protein DKX38_009200 [Salix brachista]
MLDTIRIDSETHPIVYSPSSSSLKDFEAGDSFMVLNVRSLDNAFYLGLYVLEETLSIQGSGGYSYLTEILQKFDCLSFGTENDRTDIVDEAILFFRANVFSRNFDIQSPADKLLVYLTFYINVALKRLEGCRTLAEGTKAIINLGLEKVPVPGESGFPFPGLFADPQSQKEAGNFLFMVFFPETLLFTYQTMETLSFSSHSSLPYRALQKLSSTDKGGNEWEIVECRL